MLTIGVVASEIGVSPATLRKWETRYGFPVPERSSNGTRLYPAEVVARLREAKRQLELGFRPSVIFAGGALTQGVTQQNTEQPTTADTPQHTESEAFSDELICLLQSHDLHACKRRLDKALFSLGVCRFVEEIAAPLMRAVGKAWARGELEVFAEHGITVLMHSVLDEATRRTCCDTAFPTIVLATPSGERHTLGLAMATASLTDAGAHCVNLGASLPAAEMIAAAQAYRADILGLSLSCSAPPRLASKFLADLRDKLPASIELWVSGDGAKALSSLPPGTRHFSTAREARPLIRARNSERAVDTHADPARQR